VAIRLSPLPWARDALVPHLSAETVDCHYGRHHQGYVTKLNEQIAGTGFEQLDLETIVMSARGAMVNNAAQAWNHAFYWNCLKPDGGGAPTGALAAAIDLAFGSFEQFKEQFTQTCTDIFGSGWAWLVRRADGGVGVTATFNASTPLTSDSRALLACDVWEHAYYIDHRNARAKYVESFWCLVNWDFVASQLALGAVASSADVPDEGAETRHRKRRSQQV
jgi:Fe-Mn family superoxide dismutase